MALAALVVTTSGLLASGPSLQTVRLSGRGRRDVGHSLCRWRAAFAKGRRPHRSAAHLPRFPGRRGGDGRHTRQRGPPGPRRARGGQPIAAFGDSRRDRPRQAGAASNRRRPARRLGTSSRIVVGVRRSRREPPKAAAPAKAPATVPAVPAAAPAVRRAASRVPIVAADRAPHRRRGRRGVGLSLSRWRASFAGGWGPHRSAGHLPRFPDVAAATEGMRVNGDLLVRGVRVAVNQSRPSVTRVVIDLARAAPYRIEAGLRASGQLTIVVGVPVAQAGEPAGSWPPVRRSSRAPPERLAARTPAKDVAQYLQRASSLLERLERLRPLLVSLDALSVLPEEQLKAAAAGVRVDPTGAGGDRAASNAGSHARAVP